MASMAVTGSMKRSKLIAAGSALLACQLPMIAHGAEWGGGIEIGASYTDNVFLATAPDEMDDIAYQASPFLSFVHESPTFDAMLDYTFDWFKYSDVDSTSKYHSGVASVTGKAWEESLLAELGGRRSQTLRDPNEVIPQGILPLSGNLIDEDEWWFNPGLVRNLGSVVTLTANYRYAKIQYDDSMVQDHDNQTAGLGIENYRAARGLTWALRYDWRRTEYEFSAPWEHQQATAELGFWMNNRTRVFGAGGKESAWDDPLDPAMDDSFWEVGFAHAAGENLSVEIAAGERSFGTSWRGDIEYSFRRGSTSISYDESPTTNGYNDGGPRFVNDPFQFDDFLSRPGTAERYLSERLAWNLDLELRRTTFGLALFDEDRSGRTAATGESLDDQSESGISVLLSWKAGVRTEFVVSGSLVDQETSAGNKSKFKDGGLAVNYTLGARSDLSLSYNYDEQQPRGENASGSDYVSNVVTLTFTYTM